MYLLLTHDHDPSGPLLREVLGARLPEVLHLRAADFARVRRFRFELGARDGARLRIELPDGRTMAGEEVVGVVNRLFAPPPRSQAPVHAEDRGYVTQEWWAITVAWLGAFAGPVLNPASTSGLAGILPTPEALAVEAHRAGFRSPEVRRSSLDDAPNSRGPSDPSRVVTALVVGNAAVTGGGAPLDDATTARVARVAARFDLPLCVARLVLDPDGPPELLGLDAIPELAPFRACLGDLVADYFDRAPRRESNDDPALRNPVGAAAPAGA